MSYEEAKEKAVSWARSKGEPEFSEEKIIEGIENENTFVFIEKVPQKKTGKGKFDFFFISPRVFVVDKKTGEVMFRMYSDSDIEKYTDGTIIENGG